MSDFDNSSKLAPLDNPFWQFSIRVYQANQIQELCHTLQDSDGVNVNLLLYCCWLAYEVEDMPKNEFNLACQIISSWHDNVTANLRNARRSIEQSGEEQAWLKDFYKRVLMDEILSESYQQILLYKSSPQLKSRPSIDTDLAYRYLTWLFDVMGSSIDEKKKRQLQDLVSKVQASLEEKVSE